MHPKIILKVLGILLMVFSLTLIPPIIIALIYQDGGMSDFALSAIGLFIAGFSLWLPSRKEHHDLKIRDGFLIVVIFWTALGFAGAIPMYFATGINLSLSDAIFESFSGLTTTGATVINGLDNLPHAILWYRQQLQWLGGMGIIVLAVAILPMLGIGGMQLYRAETPGPIKDNKLAPRISETAKSLWYIYLGITTACAVSFWVAGMNWFDAIGHSFSTVAIGGFSTHDASIGHFDSVHIEVITMIFMYIAGINFALHFTAFRHMTVQRYLSDPEYKVYTLILLGGILIVSTYLYSSHTYASWEDALRFGSFQVMSIATTAGFASADFSSWPAFLPIFLILMSYIGGSAYSTGGGMKVIRIMLLFKQGLREVHKLLHPNALMPVKLSGKPVSEKIMAAVWGFFSLYVFIVVLATLLLMAMELDPLTAFSAVTATITNLGPGLGEVAANFSELSDPAKLILSFLMVLGRLELFTILVLFTAAFWRK
ncbi:TrkH family potassium uptake protein [Hydrogenovibrio sp. 3SP14C1]|uniref:TrkH family potassium uptake protein n=1 Tax=Hydrogenovibrio sp. 3SP14C1 TaxID=3038774 RepID=UPI0024164A28|nr:TrkH family potassium uptake protein [Hydrogenovibrio sp. 3SP14C1]MDG4813241.1 TrkH family potassium uptake protein [Hydrogenovibrio sp. 3SP14C1]